MERLTWVDMYDGAFVDIEDVYITKCEGAKVVSGNAIFRLAEYEDTGLTPEEIVTIKNGTAGNAH